MLQKQPIDISFAQGVNTKPDPFRIPIGQFQALTNAVFTKQGLLQKRNGFGNLVKAPTSAQTLATLNGGLVSLGTTCQSYSADSGKLTNAGLFQPMNLSTTTMVRRATSQTTCDVAVASNGLACSTWLDSDTNSYYQVSDSVTGQIVVPAVALPSTAVMSRVYALGPYFVVTFLATVSAATHLQYVAVPITNPASPIAAVDVSTQASGLTAAYDGQVFGTNLYLALNGSDGGGAIRVTYITSTLLQPATTVIASVSASLISVAVDSSGSSPAVWVSWFKTNLIKASALSGSLVSILSPTNVATSLPTVNELASTATANVLTSIYESANTYSYTPTAPQASDTKTDFVSQNTLTLSGTAGSPAVVSRGVGLASRALIVPSLSKTVFLATYGQQFQPTYFLMDLSGNVLARLAYSNGKGYALNQVIPNINLVNNTLQVGYLFADLLQAVNKTQGASLTGVYSQLGINLATFNLTSQTSTLEIGGSLSASGGLLWQYDGVKVRELGFNVWPEDVGTTTATTGGFLTAQVYYYQVTYEWTDAAGQIHRSAPSIPVIRDLSSSMTSTNANTINVPTLRQTYKTDNKVRIVAYRWSTANQVFYQVTSVTNPTLNDPTVDSVQIVDTLADSSIIGNNIIYTAGGVIEDICAPGSNAMTLFQSRLFLADAEDPNLVWFSKAVIEATPVEMSDLLTIFIAPTTGAQGSTGPITALYGMDDKLLVFKQDAMYYVTGTGPDNTGNNGTFSDPVFINGTVGTSNPQSIVLTPQGVMFQSDKGIWLLGRDLSTSYVGAPVEDYTQGLTVTSALCIPGTNQVRFTMSNKTAVMYDYYFNQWSNWVNVPAVSSTVFQSLHTYLSFYGEIVQETLGTFMDSSSPVLIGLTTGWINLAGVQGYERFYFANLLGTYFSPFNLTAELAYDYNPSPIQSTTIKPDNFVLPWGGESNWGAGQSWGGPGNVFSARLFPQKQKCESFQVTLQEVYDPSLGQAAGQGLTLSGLGLVVGMKKGYRTQKASRSFG